MFRFSNSSLPATVPKFQYSSPLLNLKSSQVSAPLFVVDSFRKYGVIPQVTELTNPDATYNLYKLEFPFSSVLGVGVENFVRVQNLDRLAGQRLYLDGTTLYFASNTVPTAYQVTVEFNAPIPRTVCELITSVPAGMVVNRVLYKGIPLNFGQVGQQLTIDCSDSCCRIRGGETLELTGTYSASPSLIGQAHVFSIEQNLGLIDYIEWRGRRFVTQQEEIKPGQFLWDVVAKSLKLIL